MTVDGFTGLHETISEMGMLIERVFVPRKGNNVLVVAGRELLVGKREGRFEHDLCRCSAQIEYSSRRFPFFATNITCT